MKVAVLRWRNVLPMTCNSQRRGFTFVFSPGVLTSEGIVHGTEVFL